MAGSPKKSKKFSSTVKLVYRFLYLFFVLLSLYAVFRSAQPLISSNSSDYVVKPEENALFVAAETIRKNAEMMKETLLQSVGNDLPHKTLKWVEKPVSLCFGHGNITIATVAVNLPKEYVYIMRKNRLHYCSLHNYRYCEVSIDLDLQSFLDWTKVKSMLLVLSFSPIVFHMDADTLFMNTSQKIESILQIPNHNTSKKDVIYTADFSIGKHPSLNTNSNFLVDTGVYLMRNSEWTKFFLETQYNYRNSMYKKYWDKDAIVFFQRKYPKDFASHVEIIPYRYMNVPCGDFMSQYIPGDFICHFMGGKGNEKYEKIVKLFRESQS